MKIIKPSVEILTPVDGAAIMKHLEVCGRVCYKSEDKITDTSADAFLAGIIKRGHEAVVEHYNITVKFTCDRGVSHEIVRHRLASYCQESTRYCNYSTGNNQNPHQDILLLLFFLLNVEQFTKHLIGLGCIQ